MHAITRSCVLFLWMQTLTSVKSQDCTLEQFLKSRMFDSNFDTSDLEASYPSGKQVRVSCSVGYSGFFRLTCSEGTWQSRGAKCQPRSCGHPGDAQFAEFQLEKGDDFVFGSQVVYTCHQGYQMVSRRNVRRCMAEGWDGVIPVCEAQQCPVIHVDSNVQVTGDTEEANYGNVLRFSCKFNTEMMIGSPEIYCDENGQWSGQAPKCKVIKCTVPVIENGDVLGDIQEYNEHDVLHFACKPHYRPAENRPSKCLKLGIKAEWSPTPVCEPIKCKLDLPALEGTTYEPAFRNLFSPGDTVRVICGEKYWISRPQDTSAVITCKEDGTWTLATPVCQEVTCSNQRDPLVEHWAVSWWQRLTMGETVTYRCRWGYKKTEGATLATCTRYGWRPNPLCQAITCDRLDIQNADIVRNNKQTYRYNERVDYVCKDGYRGSFTLTCRDSGWNGNQQCTAIADRCNPPPKVENAVITTSYQKEYLSNSEVTYRCHDNYTMEGEDTIRCKAGEWEKKNIACTEVVGCGTPPFLADGDIKYTTKSQYSHNERVEYMCQSYYTMEGEPYSTCINGEWTGHMRCLKPCVVDEDDIRQKNILKSSDSLYFAHDEVIEFNCARGILVGAVAMHQRCNDGVLLLPTCH